MVDDHTGDRLRRWGKEYGGYVAAGAVAIVVLVCATTALTDKDATWHAGEPVAAEVSSALAGTGSPVVRDAASPAIGRSPSASRSPAQRTTSAPQPSGTTSASASRSPSRSPSPSPALLGPASGSSLREMVNAYCSQEFRGFAVLRRQSGATNNWVCQYRQQSQWRTQSVNMTDVCVHRYGKGAVASYSDAKDPLSWRCYSG